VLDVAQAERSGETSVFRFAKDFHVSPFLPMDINYEWRFSEPGNTLFVHMIDRQNENLVFDATLALKRRSISTQELAVALLLFPFMTLKVIFLIHWQALRLLVKRTPFYNHPDL
jgi:DUF1365 family protein